MYYHTSVSQTNAHIIEMCEEYGKQIYIYIYYYKKLMRLPNLNLNMYHSFDTHDLFHQTSQLSEEYLAIHLKHRDVLLQQVWNIHIQYFGI